LDIYWETSSAGLISELNEAIRNSVNSTEADIAPFNDSPFEEDLSNGEDILASDFVVIDVGNFGAPVDPNLVTLTTESITYTGNEGLDASEILEVYETATPGAWNIRTKQGFVDNIWYSEDPNNRNFIINLSVSVENKGSADVNGAVTNSTDVLIDNLTTNFIPAVGATVTGAGITSSVKIVSYDSGLSKLVLDTSVSLANDTALTIENGQPSVTRITKTVELDNQPPDIFDGYNPQGSIIPSSSVIDLTTIPFKDGYVMKSLSGVNGANTPNAGQEVDFRIVDVIGSNDGSFLNNFNIIKNETESTESLVAVDLVLSSISGLNIDYTYQAVVNLKDAGGEESSIAFDFKFGTKPASIKTRQFFGVESDGRGEDAGEDPIYTVITIADQPISNNSNGIYYFRGSPEYLKSLAADQVITIDRVNASVFGVGCSNARSDWAFASGSGTSAETNALNIAIECLVKDNDGYSQLRDTNELENYSFQVI